MKKKILKHTIFTFLLMLMMNYHYALAFPWFNRGLDKQISKMKYLFSKKELYVLYKNYVHPDIKKDLNKLICKMKEEKTDINKISKRIGFASLKQFLNANNDEIIKHFFETMISKKYKKPSNIKNSAYLKIIITLTLLFAFLDEGNVIINKDIGFSCATYKYAGTGFSYIVYFYRDNGKWWLSDGRYCN